MEVKIVSLVAAAVASAAACAFELGDKVYSLYEGKDQGYQEKTLWRDADAAIVYEGEYAMIPVEGVTKDDVITPVVVYGGAGASNLGSPVVWNDYYVFQKVNMISKAGWRESEDGRFRTYYDPNARKPVFYRWPTELWATGAVDNRVWIGVPVRRSADGGLSPTFRVGISGTDQYTRTIYINRTDALVQQNSAFTPEGVFGLSVSGYSKLQPSVNHAGDRLEDETRDWRFVGHSSSDNIKLSIGLPSAGELVVPGYDGEIAYTVSSVVRQYGLYKNDAGWGRPALWLRSTGATRVTLTVLAHLVDFDGLWFYPSGKRSVAVRCELKHKRPTDGGGTVDELPATVTGTGVYEEGSKVTISVTPYPGAELVGWELPAGVTRTIGGPATDCSFTVPASVCGEASDHKVITVRPIWRSRIAAFTLPQPAGYGSVTGCGDFLPDADMTNSVKSLVKGKSVLSFYDVGNAAYIESVEGAKVIYRFRNGGSGTVASTINAFFGDSPLLTVAVDDDSHGSATPKPGRYEAGSTLTLKATAKRGWAHTSWKRGDELLSITPSFQYTTGVTDETVTAHFISTEDDVLHGISLKGAEPEPVNAGEATEISFWVDSLSQPKVTVKGLPTGLKATLAVRESPWKDSIWAPDPSDPLADVPDLYHALVISGTPTKPGVYDVTASITSASVKTPVVEHFTVKVANFTSPYIYGLDPAFDAYGLTAGVTLDGTEIQFVSEYGWTVSVTGLPTGLKYNAKTGLITGTATRSGTYTVTFTAKNGREKTVASITVTVAAIDAGAAGTFNGLLKDGDGAVVGSVTASATAQGRVTLKAMTPAGTKSFSATGWDSLNGGVYSKAFAIKGASAAITVDPAAAADAMQLSGECILADGAPAVSISAQRNPFGKTGKVYENPDAVALANTLAGTYAFDLLETAPDQWELVEPANPKKPELKLTVTKTTGAVKVSGKVGGRSVSASGVLQLDGTGAKVSLAAVALRKGVTAITVEFTSEGLVAPGASAVWKPM